MNFIWIAHIHQCRFGLAPFSQSHPILYNNSSWKLIKNSRNVSPVHYRMRQTFEKKLILLSFCNEQKTKSPIHKST
ncbi:hypothetical protein BLOT_000179 [Blomia tropicalis]|nr:hypothetical protein BLOT_000179 [Blomia tropicalis]